MKVEMVFPGHVAIEGAFWVESDKSLKGNWRVPKNNSPPPPPAKVVCTSHLLP